MLTGDFDDWGTSCPAPKPALDALRRGLAARLTAARAPTPEETPLPAELLDVFIGGESDPEEGNDDDEDNDPARASGADDRARRRQRPPASSSRSRRPPPRHTRCDSNMVTALLKNMVLSTAVLFFVVLPLSLLVSVGLPVVIIAKTLRRSALTKATSDAAAENPESVVASGKAQTASLLETESVVAADKTRALLERASRFADTTVEPVVLTNASDGTIVYCNDAWVSMCGYSREEALGRTNRELLQGAQTDMTVARELGVALAEGAPEAQATLWNYKKDDKVGFWNDLHVQRLAGTPSDGAECAIFVGFLKEVLDGGADVQIAEPVPAEQHQQQHQQQQQQPQQQPGDDGDDSKCCRATEMFRCKRIFSPYTGNFREAHF